MLLDIIRFIIRPWPSPASRSFSIVKIYHGINTKVISIIMVVQLGYWKVPEWALQVSGFLAGDWGEASAPGGSPNGRKETDFCPGSWIWLFEVQKLADQKCVWSVFYRTVVLYATHRNQKLHIASPNRIPIGNWWAMRNDYWIGISAVGVLIDS